MNRRLCDIDFVEVVRCMDCRFYHKDFDDKYDCHRPCGMMYPCANDFCSYGERRDDDD